MFTTFQKGSLLRTPQPPHIPHLENLVGIQDKHRAHAGFQLHLTADRQNPNDPKRCLQSPTCKSWAAALICCWNQRAPSQINSQTANPMSSQIHFWSSFPKPCCADKHKICLGNSGLPHIEPSCHEDHSLLPRIDSRPFVLRVDHIIPSILKQFGQKDWTKSGKL